MNLSNVILNRPDKVNRRYYGDIRLTLDSRTNGKDVKKSLYGVLGRAWQNDASGNRWFFQPYDAPTTDENVYLVFAESLIG